MDDNFIDMEFIRGRILELRNTTTLSDRKLSLELGYNPSYIKEILAGRNKPTLEGVLNICDYFKITITEFFDKDNDNPVLMKEIYRELARISNNNLIELHSILKVLQPQDYNALVSLLKRYSKSEK